MILLRRVLGDALRARRQSQQRTLREVSTAANVSLGYLSEIERGQKEASSELLAAICDALGAQLSEVLREASDTMALAEHMEGMEQRVEGMAPVVDSVASAGDIAVYDGDVAVAVHRTGPLKTMLRATRTGSLGREVVRAA